MTAGKVYLPIALVLALFAAGVTGRGEMHRASFALRSGAKRGASREADQHGVVPAAKTSKGNRTGAWTVHWEHYRFTGLKSLEIHTTIGWTPGAHRPKPRIKHVRVVERAGAIVVTAFLDPRVPRAPNPCACVALPLDHAVRLHHPLNDRAVYDGSTSPPARRHQGGILPTH